MRHRSRCPSRGRQPLLSGATSAMGVTGGKVGRDDLDSPSIPQSYATCIKAAANKKKIIISNLPEGAVIMKDGPNLPFQFNPNQEQRGKSDTWISLIATVTHVLDWILPTRISRHHRDFCFSAVSLTLLHIHTFCPSMTSRNYGSGTRMSGSEQ